MKSHTLISILASVTREWMAVPGVVGTALGEEGGNPCIVVLSEIPEQDLRPRIPEQVHGHAVVIRPCGPLHALEP
jgi:hypothetical protein